MTLQAEFRSSRDAEEDFHRALETARRQRARSFELRAMMSLSRLRWRQGRSEEARQQLADVFGWFTEGFDTVDLMEAKALLEQGSTAWDARQHCARFERQGASQHLT